MKILRFSDGGKDLVYVDRAKSEVNYARFPIYGLFLLIYIAALDSE